MRESFEQLIYTKRDRVIEVTLNRPGVLNALSVQLYTELADAVACANRDRDIRVIVITGAGRAFSAGGDLKQGEKINRGDPTLFANASNRMLVEILRGEKIVISKVNGMAQAGGLLIVAASDLSIASDQATFKCPEVLVGLWEPYSPGLLSDLVGLKRAKHLLLTAETIGASEAERIGLINAVVPHSELDRATELLIGKILKGAPRALGEFKRMLNSRIREFDTGIVAQALSSQEAEEGMSAFSEGREPCWREI